MRIAYVSVTYPKLSETFIRSEIATLRDLGHDVRVFAKDYESEADPSTCYARPTELIRRSPAFFRILRRFSLRHSGWMSRVTAASGATQLLAEVRAFQPDIVHAHFATVQTAVALALSGEINVPCTAMFHANDYLVGIRPEQLAERIADLDATFCISEAARIQISERAKVSVDDLEVVRASFSASLLSRSTRTETANLTPQLCCVARLVPKKGHAELILGFLQYLQDGGDADLTIIGDGPLLDELRSLAAPASSRIQFTGALPHADALSRLEASDAAIMTPVVTEGGDADGIPVFLLEAAALRIPVATTLVGGIGELITSENGVVMGDLSVKTVARAITCSLDSKITRPLVAAARARIDNEFSPALQADRLLATWQKVISQRTRSTP